VRRHGEDLLSSPIDDLAEVHDGNAARHVLDNSRIAADEEQRDVRKTSTHEGLWNDRNGTWNTR
jgi:hypothetical protein